jgi:hypothetical protein
MEDATMDEEREGVNPSELPDDPTRAAGDAAGIDPEEADEGRAVPTEDLDADPAHSFDGPEADLKGG